jgi:hypothetical protein
MLAIFSFLFKFILCISFLSGVPHKVLKLHYLFFADSLPAGMENVKHKEG